MPYTTADLHRAGASATRTLRILRSRLNANVPYREAITWAEALVRENLRLEKIESDLRKRA